MLVKVIYLHSWHLKLLLICKYKKKKTGSSNRATQLTKWHFIYVQLNHQISRHCNIPIIFLPSGWQIHFKIIWVWRATMFLRWQIWHSSVWEIENDTEGKKQRLITETHDLQPNRIIKSIWTPGPKCLLWVTFFRRTYSWKEWKIEQRFGPKIMWRIYFTDGRWQPKPFYHF